MTTTPPALPEWKPRSKLFGQLALAGAVVVLLGSVLAALLIGAATAPFVDLSAGDGAQFSLDANAPDPAERAVAIASLVHIGLGTLLGIAALVAGILAIVSRRGRGYGIAAVIIAVLAPGISLLTLITSLSLSVQF